VRELADRGYYRQGPRLGPSAYADRRYSWTFSEPVFFSVQFFPDGRLFLPGGPLVAQLPSQRETVVVVVLAFCY